jgi:uncharacterized protein (DUF2384 family)
MEMAPQYSRIIEDLPVAAQGDSVLRYLMVHDVTGSYFNIIKNVTRLNDDHLSTLLNMDVKTFRKYKSAGANLNPITGEYTVMLLALYKHGQSLFGSFETFGKWLSEPNFFFDGNPPLTFLSTLSGIQYIDERLTAMAYGDNA